MENTSKTSPSSSSPQHIEKYAQEFGAKTGQMAHNLTNTASHYVQSSRDYVQQHPVRSVGMAAAVGLITGSLLTMAARRKEH